MSWTSSPPSPLPPKKKKKGERPQVSINLTGKTIGLIVFFFKSFIFQILARETTTMTSTICKLIQF